MIYNFVETPSEAMADMVDFYGSQLADEINTDCELTTPEAYILDVIKEAKDKTDSFGNEIEALILKACGQKTTLKKLTAEYSEAKADPKEFAKWNS